jgi:hypothetical protein
MEIKIAISVHARKLQTIEGKWVCDSECQFNDSNTYCQLFDKYTGKYRLDSCINSVIKED